MYPVVYLSCDLKNKYSEYSFFSKIKDSLNTSLVGESFIDELKLTIARVKLPPNFHKKAYMKNVERCSRFVGEKNYVVSPRTLREYDYKLLNSFQKNLFSYSVAKSVQLLLRVKGKSIKNSCILMHGVESDMGLNILQELSKQAKFIVLLSDKIGRVSKISDYIVSNYGVTPVITNDAKYAVGAADFIISDKILQTPAKVPVWYLDNSLNPGQCSSLAVNDVSYKVPWNIDMEGMPPELLGAILSQMGEKDVEKSLKYNGVYLDRIKYNESTIG